MTMEAASIFRHRTAMVRHAVSQPVSLMLQHGLLRPDLSFFDYGCGKGDDLRILAGAGLAATGWDPHFAPDLPLEAADIVNIGFVLNVIEDEAERREALARAWGLARRVLAVSTMVVGQASTEGLRPYRDGFFTSRGTFQKYFAHAELRALIAGVSGVDPIAAGPGIFFAFRDAEEQEDFLLRRRMGRRLGTAAYRVPRERHAIRGRPALAERLAPALEEIADLARMRGRVPVAEELPEEILGQLAAQRVSYARAIEMALALHLDADDLEAAAAGMREDLLVHFALARLNQRAAADRPGAAMVRDIRAHFGSQRELLAAATAYLMGLADAAAINAATRAAAADGIGAVDQRGRLLLDARRAEELPGILRVYLGCAAYLGGEAGDEALIRIDSTRRMVSYFALASREACFPAATSVTTIDLQRQSMTVRPGARLLIAKSRIVGAATEEDREAETAWRRAHDVSDDVLLVKSE